MSKKTSKTDGSSKRSPRRVKVMQLSLKLVSRNEEYRAFMLTSDEIKFIRGDGVSVFKGLSK